MDIAQIATRRYTAKAYDRNQRIDDALIAQLKTLLHLAPSSVNSQPWHFFIAADDAAKAQIARATTGPYSGNEPKVLDASHVVVLCARNELDDEHLERVLAQEERDGRYPAPEAKAAQIKGRGFYVNQHREELHDSAQWMEKQVYLALGSLLFGAAALGIDATPIEGFDRKILDETLGLNAQGLHAVVLAALGYHSDADFNADLPKSRLPLPEILSEL